MTQSDAAFKTVCKEQPLLFQDLGARKVVADFSGGYLSSDGGILLLRQLDSSIGLTRSLSRCFRDGRDARFVEHELDELISQRVLGLAAGYEDLNDHNHLRLDPLFAVAVGKSDPLATRRAERDRGKALASTLNRLELGNNKVGSRAQRQPNDPPFSNRPFYAIFAPTPARCRHHGTRVRSGARPTEADKRCRAASHPAGIRVIPCEPHHITEAQAAEIRQRLNDLRERDEKGERGPTYGEWMNLSKAASEGSRDHTYSGVFNPAIDDAELIICDDAHAADNYVSSSGRLR